MQVHVGENGEEEDSNNVEMGEHTSKRHSNERKRVWGDK